MSGAELSTIVSSFPNLESFSLHQFQIQSLPAHIPNLSHLKKLSLEYMQLALTDVEKIVNSCPKLEMLFCVALRTLNSNNNMLLTSPSLQHLAIKECLVNKIIVNNCPAIKTLHLSYLRNSDILFSILGSCEHFSTIEVKKCDSAITESIVNAVITASKSEAVAHIPHFVKVKSLFSGSLEDVENEIFWSFHGHVALVRGPAHHHYQSPELIHILRAIKDRTKVGVPYGSTMTSLLRAEPAVMMSENTLLRTNFPLAGLTSNYDKCLVIITNEKDGRIL
jgi:Leucine-rich repeat (LRR) protein